MGAWGTSLYETDTTSNIHGDYVDLLRKGKTNAAAMQALIDAYQNVMGQMEEEPLFWFALADIQWNYGRLLPEVKEKALYFLSQDYELERWKASGEKQQRDWENTLEDLKKKLLSPQPQEKKISKYQLYRCKWKLGDVFAYRFCSEYSKEKGFYNQHVVFRKVSEDVWWQGHIIPVVQVYKWIGCDIPPLEKLSDFGLLPAFCSPAEFVKFSNQNINYDIKLLSDSEQAIPKDNLQFLGNLPGDDFVPLHKHDYWEEYAGVGWESSEYNTKFEHHIIDQFLAWKDMD